MIIGIGHDLELCEELAGRQSLFEPNVMFTEHELVLAVEGKDDAERLIALATLFSAKKAFFKALPVQSGWLWCELELLRDGAGRPHFRYGGALGELMLREGWSALLSISHGGAYVSSVVLLQSNR